ncbi:Os12g0509400 [Oryza sativa Japonica Group]|uniref:Os12g0509400 protein n=1 Tax=Oryza sativa subsp. japonica TaxID=39947 RepID=A0A0P0YAM6_ORYSJ|nr:hypothetical protein EE612_059808 [Oryza sativa]BAT17317.1 Os12g0509400 [Oryza sativa Japonica Group]
MPTEFVFRREQQLRHQSSLHPFPWLRLLSWTSQVAPFLKKNDTFVAALKKELSEHIADVHVQNDFLDGMFTFCGATMAPAPLNRAPINV